MEHLPIIITVSAAAVLLLVLYRYYTSRQKPYHVAERALRSREALAAATSDAGAQQQVRLEKLWLEQVASAHMMEYTARQGTYTTQAAIDAARYRVLAQLTSEQVILPSPHSEPTKRVQRFFHQLLHETEATISNSSYFNSDFIPAAILPYPKSYLLFAADSLTKTDSRFVAIKKVLTENVV